MSLSIDEKAELERLLMVRDHWAKFVKPEKPVLVSLVVPEASAKKNQACGVRARRA
jgi:hypothetical protein